MATATTTSTIAIIIVVGGCKNACADIIMIVVTMAHQQSGLGHYYTRLHLRQSLVPQIYIHVFTTATTITNVFVCSSLVPILVSLRSIQLDILSSYVTFIPLSLVTRRSSVATMHFWLATKQTEIYLVQRPSIFMDHYH